MCNHNPNKGQFSICVILCIIIGCNQASKQKEIVKDSSNFKIQYVNDSEKLVIETKGDTVYKHFLDLKGIKDDNFDNSYTAKTITNIISIDSNIKSNLYISEGIYNVHFNPIEIIHFCDSSIKLEIESNSDKALIDDLRKLKYFATSSNSGQVKQKFVSINWLPTLLLNCNFSIFRKTDENKSKMKSLIVEKYQTEFSKGKNFFLLTQEGDTLNFFHNLDYIK